ncbi:Mitochondrial acidic protein mam33 [Thoreauomyces humboldtii]|nr:Mitochondrial acidic protein mam33 [Thoreauomyces humboldtii]
MLFRIATRCVAASALRPAARLAPQVVRPVVAASRSFTASAFTRMSAGESDLELHATLVREITHETKENAEARSDDFVSEFKTANPEWTIVDQPLSKEVSLTRTFGNEKITVLFNTDALAEADDFQEELGEGEEAQQDEPSIPVTVVIAKTDAPEAGALDIGGSIQDGTFFIESAGFSATASLALDETAQGDWTRRSKYAGPVFEDLDENLQEQMHAYLAERGLDESLSSFIPRYLELKEQNEYLGWLKNVAAFVKK